MPNWKKIITSGSAGELSSLFAPSITGSLLGTASYSTTASYVLPLQQDVQITGSLNVSGSTIQIGNNTLLGNTTLSGSIIMSGSATNPTTPTIQVYGDMETNGVIKFTPVTKNIDTTISASYIYVSGSTNDLYFSQNGSGYTSFTRLSWLEGNLYTGLLSGGVITSTPGSTTFSISSGSGIIVSLNAFTSSADPFPTIQYVTWPTTTQPITNSGSAKITYVGINNVGTVVQQTVPWGSTNIDQWDQQIELGTVLHLSGSVSTGVYNSPQVGYGEAQRTDDFVRSFGPLKISGHVLQASGSTLSIIKTGGTAYNNGANYIINPNHPSTVIDPAINVSKIYRYYISGSTPVIDTGIAAAGYTVIDPSKYVRTSDGTLQNIPGGQYSIQRVFWFPNSPTNAFIVYYGNDYYNSAANAQLAFQTEVFTEAPNTAQNAIFLGSIIVDASETNLQNATIVPAGLFRQVGGIGSTGTTPVSTALSSLSDVAITSVTAGDLLTYGGGQWNNSKTLNGTYTINGGLTVTGSLIATASRAISASYSETASYVNPLRQTVLVTGNTKIDVITTGNTDGLIINKSGSFTRGQIVLTDDNNLLWRFGLTSGAGNTSFNFFNGANDVLTINRDFEQVGIGVNPGTVGTQAKLHINNTSTSASFLVEDSTNPDTTPFVIDASGNVGIGIASTDPLFSSNTKLQVYTSGSLQRAIRIRETSTSASFNFWAITSSDGTRILRLDQDTTGTNVMTWAQTGEVGIGITGSIAKLHINNTTPSASFLVEDSTNPDTTPFVIDAAGNVGIGTTTPKDQLTLSGGNTVGSGIRLENGTAIKEASTIRQTGFHSTLYLASNLYYSGSTAPEDNSYYISDTGSNNRGGNLFYIKSNAGTLNPSSGFYFYTAPTSSGTDTLATLTENFRIIPGTASFSNNNVGIGITAPTAKLHVTNTGTDNSFLVEDSGNIDATPFVIDNVGRVAIGTGSAFEKVTIQNGNIALKDSTNSEQTSIVFTPSDNTLRNYITTLNSASATDDYMKVGSWFGSVHLTTGNIASPTTHLFVSRSGNIGVGITSSLNARFHINNTTTQNSFLVEDDTNPDATPFVIDNSGAVAIGQTSSLSGIKLTVNGNTLLNNNYLCWTYDGASNNDYIVSNDSPHGGSGNTPGFYVFKHDSTLSVTSGSGNSTLDAGSIWMNGSTQTNYIAGNVGIGTTTPRETLGITGTGIRITDQFGTEASTIRQTNFHSTLYLASNLYYSGSANPETNSYYVLDSGSNNRGGNLFYIKTNAGGGSPASGFFFYTAPTSSGANTLATLTENFKIIPGTASFSNNIVGIGTSSPTAKLHVNNTGTINSLLVEDSTNPDATPFVIDASGNVGIGTLTPISELTVSASGVDGILIGTDTSAGNQERSGRLLFGQQNTARSTAIFAVSGAMYFSTLASASVSSGTTRMYISESGNVGIGTVTPTQGTLQVVGNVFATSFTGSLFGTASWAQNAVTASFITTAQTASYVLNAVSSSFASTASFVNTLNQNVIITGSVAVTQNITASAFATTDALITSTATTINSGITTIYNIPTASYDGAWFDYTIRSGSNARAGSVMGIWSGTAVNYTETTTTDFGNTSGFALGMSVVGANMILSSSATTSGWSFNAIVRSI